MPRLKQGFLPVVLVLCAALAAGACVNLNKSYPEKKNFALVAVRPADAPARGQAAPVLRLRRFTSSPAFENQNFVYRTGRWEYSFDYYNQFFVSPPAMITSAARRWLNDSGLFSLVTDKATVATPGFVLEGNLSALYGDYRPGADSAAVVEMQFCLLDIRRSPADVVFQKHYVMTEGLATDDPDDLATAWNQALKDLLTTLEEDVATAMDKVQARTPPPGAPSPQAGQAQ